MVTDKKQRKPMAQRAAEKHAPKQEAYATNLCSVGMSVKKWYIVIIC